MVLKIPVNLVYYNHRDLVHSLLVAMSIFHGRYGIEMCVSIV